MTLKTGASVGKMFNRNLKLISQLESLITVKRVYFNGINTFIYLSLNGSNYKLDINRKRAYKIETKYYIDRLKPINNFKFNRLLKKILKVVPNGATFFLYLLM